MVADPATAPSPSAPLRISSPRRRLPFHVVLFGLTFLTATAAGAWFWEGGFVGGEGWRELLSIDLLTRGLTYSIWLLLILGAHEMGHYLACRRYGIPATLPFFLPGIPPLGTFGAVIRIRGAIPDRKALFDVAAAGPIAGFAVALPAIVLGLLNAEPAAGAPIEGEVLLGSPVLTQILGRWIHGDDSIRVGSLYGAGWVGMLVTSMNLFPVGQLDGGHAVYAISSRLHRAFSWSCCGALATFVAWQAVVARTLPAYTVWLIVLLVLRDRHPRLADVGGRLGGGRLAIALILALVFALSFIPFPVSLAEGS